MPNKGYQKGYRFELEVKKYLESKGCLVFRSAGSHSLVDLVAFSPQYKVVYFVQCKYGTSKMNKQDIVRLTRLADKFNTIPVYCSRKPTASIVLMNMNTTTEICL